MSDSLMYIRYLPVCPNDEKEKNTCAESQPFFCKA